MKRMLRITMMIVLISVFTMNVYAKESVNGSLITRGINESGVVYNVYGTTTVNADDTITVTRTIVYEGKANVPTSRWWSETIDGITYSGTLYLLFDDYDAAGNQTTAVYNGTLTR